MSDPTTIADAIDLGDAMQEAYRLAAATLRQAPEVLAILPHPDLDPDDRARALEALTVNVTRAADLLDMAADSLATGLGQLGHDPDTWRAALALVDRLTEETSP